MLRYFYETVLLISAVLNALWFVVDRRCLVRTLKDVEPNPSGSEQEHFANPTVVAKLRRQYLAVYGIVMGADWLQGAYIYSLYREQHGLPERFIALLFVLGFLSAGVSAPFLGALADQYGRKRMCMFFCISYTLSCASTFVPSLPVLFLGRFLGGISTSILFFAFESWLLGASGTHKVSPADLSAILGRATLVNSVAAALAGVVSNELVKRTAHFTSPFAASAALLLIGFVVIGASLEENYGSREGASGDGISLHRLKAAYKIVKSDKRLMVLAFTQTCFEGSMYLFVFVWVPALQEAAPPDPPLPLGYIFSSFMMSMTLGSLLYTSIVSLSQRGHSEIPSMPQTLNLHAKFSSAVCAASATALIIGVASTGVHTRYWAFCAFEVCVGLYYPVQGMLRGILISNEHRATLSALFRVPLNIFVVVSLINGVSSARYSVLLVCAGLLFLSSLLMAGALIKPAPGPPLAASEVRVT